jgi:hypothetical protein
MGPRTFRRPGRKGLDDPAGFNPGCAECPSVLCEGAPQSPVGATVMLGPFQDGRRPLPDFRSAAQGGLVPVRRHREPLAPGRDAKGDGALGALGRVVDHLGAEAVADGFGGSDSEVHGDEVG